MTELSDVGPSLYDGLCTTRAIRRYRPEAIPATDLSKILFAATRAPSGSNRQPFRFVVLRDGPKAREAKALLARAARQLWAWKRRDDKYDEGTGRVADTPKARLARTMEHYVEHFADAPVVVLPCMIRYREPMPIEGASIYPACQTLLLAARALGYGGVMTAWHALVEDELRAVLEIPDDVFMAATITLGRPVGKHGPVRRRPIAELVFDDQWGQGAPWAVDLPGTEFTSGGPPRA
jgi:nitroreductase